jgi:hypothetical protein
MSIKVKNKLEYVAFQISSMLTLTTKSQIDDEFAWLKVFTKAEREEFKSQLYNAISDAIKANEWSNVSETIDSWVETAEIISNKKLMKRIKKSDEEYKQGKVIRWKNVQKELEQL